MAISRSFTNEKFFRGLVSISEYSERVEILMSMGAGDYFLEILRKSDDETLINFTLTVIGNVISSSEGTFFFLSMTQRL